MRQDAEPTGLLRRWGETSNTSLSGTGALCVVNPFLAPARHPPDQWPCGKSSLLAPWLSREFDDGNCRRFNFTRESWSCQI